MLVLCGLLVTSTFQARALEPGDTTPAPAQETPGADGTTNPSPTPDGTTTGPPARDADEPTGDPAPSPAGTSGSPSGNPESTKTSEPTKAPEPTGGQESPTTGGQSKALARGAISPLMSPTDALSPTTQLQNFLGVATGNTNPAINTGSNNNLGKNTQGKTVSGAAPTFVGTDWSGNLASVATTGASWSSDVTHVYADRGYVSRAGNPNNNVSSNTRYYPNGSTTGTTFSTAAGRGYVQDVAAMNTLQTELAAMRSTICSAPVEATGVLPAGDISARTINIDQYDTNNDGIAIISVGQSGTDSVVKGTLIIEGSGKVLPIFRVVDGIHFKVDSTSVLLGTELGKAMSTRPAPNSGGPDQAGAVFVKCNSGGKNFDFANAHINGIAFWDLSTGTSPAMQLSNVDGCGQFIAPKQEWSNVNLTRCAVGISEPTPEPPSLCEPSTIYGVSTNGSVYSAPETGGTATSLGGWFTLYTNWNPKAEGLNQGTNVPTPNGVNGLAIAADGTMYAYARFYQYDKNYPDTRWNLAIKMMVKGPGATDTWRWLDPRTSKPTTYLYSYNTSASPVAGAVDPRTGKYVWGGFRDGYFLIHEIDLATGKRNVTGRVAVGTTGANGDIAFDASGNLYIVAHSTTGVMTITTVTAADLTAGREINKNFTAYDSWPTAIPGSVAKASETNLYDGQVNGIAVGANGGLYIGTTKKVYQVNPVTARIIGAAITNNPFTSDSVDLTSCADNTPTTLTVQKDLRRDSNPNHEFKLTVSYTGTEITSTTAKTKPAGTTVLAEKTGPTMVTPGETFSLAETSVNLSSYTSVLTCRIDGVNGNGGVVPVSGTGTTSGSITIPQTATGKNITCTFTNTPRPTSNAFICSPGEVYALAGGFRTANTTPSGTASVYKVNTSTATMTATAANFGTVPGGGQANALGIAADGITAYALVRQGPGGSDPIYVRKYDANTNTSSTLATTSAAALGHEIVAGAVDPLTGNYWVGGMTSGQSYWRFSVYTPDGLIVRSFRLELGHSAGNGDLLFDYQGNMYVLATQGTGTPANQNLWMIPAASLQAAIDAPVGDTPVQGFRKITQLSEANRTYHSAAWGSDGYIYVAASATVYATDLSTLYRINPVNGTQTTIGEIPQSGPIIDFASCSNPYTLTLKKNIVERAQPTDQFGLRIGGGGIATDSAAAYGETSGSSTGLQQDPSAMAGPVPVLPGSQYTITETGIGATDLAKYDIGYVCRDVSQPGQPVFSQSPKVTSLPVTLPAMPSNNGTGANIECVFTNAALPVLELTKVDADDYDITLSGASFQLWKDVDGDGELDPDVDTLVGGEQTTDASGLITWSTGLEVGDYLIEELAAPYGYTVVQQVIALTLAPGKNTVVADNARRTGTVTWGKTDNAGERLSGSEWTLTGPTGPDSAQVVVADCIGDTAADCAGQDDVDHRAGYFSVTGLAWGDYTLTEKTAPAGFLLSSQVHAFTIGTGAGASFEVDLGAVVNHRQPALVIPLTGGLGTDLFLLIGGGFAALLIAGLAYQRLRMRRIQAIGIDPMA